MPRATTAPPKRPVATATRGRDATATKAAILEAARSLFGQDSYERVGVRDIARRAGINVALVNRYFGSKEQLFAEVVAERFDIAPYLPADRAQLGTLLARSVLFGKSDRHRLDSVTALLVSIPNEHAQSHLRQQLREHFIAPLARWLGGPHAELRASLIASELLGLVMLRDVALVDTLADADLETLTAVTAQSIQAKVGR